MTPSSGYMYHKVKLLHFVGIGGSGMNGIAEILVNLGYSLTGSDLRKTDITKHLESLGVKVFYDHKPENIGNADVLVISSAINPDNPEIIMAQERGIPVIRRAEMLAELMRQKYGIGVSGTHGKSTTTSIIGEILTKAGLDPTVIVGGRVVNLGSSAQLGTGEFLVAEADEFDKSFLRLTPTIAVVTNLEREHMDCYVDMDELVNSFLEFMNKVPFYGRVILCIDEPILQRLLPKIERRIFTYGFSTQADIRAVKVNFKEGMTTFDVVADDQVLGSIKTPQVGFHNVKNSLAAIAVSIELGVDFKDIQRGLKEFRGVFRRFQIKGEFGNILVVDDFGHHPTEITAALKAAKMSYNRRIVTVFQPHLYTRTRDFYLDFGKSFLDSDILVVTDVYGAREEPIPGITGEMIADAAKEYGHRHVFYEPDKQKIPQLLIDITEPNDLVLTIGAGNGGKIADEYIELLKEKTGKEKD
jgi:UDP-N-acetylmuramate--alanine ligase